MDEDQRSHVVLFLCDRYCRVSIGAKFKIQYTGANIPHICNTDSIEVCSEAVVVLLRYNQVYWSPLLAHSRVVWLTRTQFHKRHRKWQESLLVCFICVFNLQ